MVVVSTWLNKYAHPDNKSLQKVQQKQGSKNSSTQNLPPKHYLKKHPAIKLLQQYTSIKQLFKRHLQHQPCSFHLPHVSNPTYLELVPWDIPHLLGCISNQLTHKALERCVSGILIMDQHPLVVFGEDSIGVFGESIALVIGIGDIYIYIWVCPKIGVPPNHPF